MSDQQKLHRFADKAYRDGYLHATVRSWIAYQVQGLREKLGLTQIQFAERLGTKQSVISKLENDKGAPNVQTLLEIASECDVALVVQFVPYPEFLARTADMSAAAMRPHSIHESLNQPAAANIELLSGFWRSYSNQQAEQFIEADNLNRYFSQNRGRRASPDSPTKWLNPQPPQPKPLNELAI